jgi:hypothetical protein
LRGRVSDLGWAVLGPAVVVALAWWFAGQAIGLLAILVMVPFWVVGVREVLSGRAAERRGRSGHETPSREKSR